MITVTEKIEKYIKENYNGKIDGAIGSAFCSAAYSLGLYAVLTAAANT